MKGCACFFFSVVLAGCTSMASETPPKFIDCAAAAAYYKARVGQDLREPVSFAIHRVLAPNSVVTMDFNPMRLNVYTDDEGLITDARCG